MPAEEVVRKERGKGTDHPTIVDKQIDSFRLLLTKLFCKALNVVLVTNVSPKEAQISWCRQRLDYDLREPLEIR